MSARESDLLRIQEIYDVATQTIDQMERANVTKESFLKPSSAQEELVAEGLVNRVLRATEEGGKLSNLFEGYGFELRQMSGLRNRLAHAYGTVDMAIVWDVLQEEFPKLVEACEDYCEDVGIKLAATWRENPEEVSKA